MPYGNDQCCHWERTEIYRKAADSEKGGDKFKIHTNRIFAVDARIGRLPLDIDIDNVKLCMRYETSPLHANLK